MGHTITPTYRPHWQCYIDLLDDVSSLLTACKHSLRLPKNISSQDKPETNFFDKEFVHLYLLEKKTIKFIGR